MDATCLAIEWLRACGGPITQVKEGSSAGSGRQRSSGSLATESLTVKEAVWIYVVNTACLDDMTFTRTLVIRTTCLSLT